MDNFVATGYALKIRTQTMTNTMFHHTHRPGFLLGFVDFFTAGLFFLFYMPLGGLQDEIETILGHKVQPYWKAYLWGIPTAFIYTLVWMARIAEELKELFALSDQALEKRLAKLQRYEQAVNGNMLVECCFSKDREFGALRLKQYEQIDYQPISEVRLPQGDAAKQAAKIFGF